MNCAIVKGCSNWRRMIERLEKEMLIYQHVGGQESFLSSAATGSPDHLALQRQSQHLFSLEAYMSYVTTLEAYSTAQESTKVSQGKVRHVAL